MYKNKTILITGGTGFFGSNFVEYISKNFNFKNIIVFSRDENKQYLMKNSLNKKYHKKIKYFLGDIRDVDRLCYAFKSVDIVVHAAALKHVPATEYNPQECIKTNVIGAQNIIDASLKNNVMQVIALSTDKAVNPINIYGASKLAADKLFVAANNFVGDQKVRFSVVRYGNVLNSRGSVIPYFRDLISKKAKFFPITDKRMTRFFISIDDGMKLVLKAMYNMQGGEIFIPKIPSINIVDLAKAVSEKMPIKITGIREGEKIHESLLTSDMSQCIIEFKKYFIVTPSIKFFSIGKKGYFKNKEGEKGKKVKSNFDYRSDNNKKFLNISEIKKII